MALIIDLKPSERIIIGEAVITNDKTRTRLHIEGDAPILREKDILREEDATTPCKRVYIMVQLMYLSANAETFHADYFKMIKEIQDAAPSTSLFFMKVNDFIYEGKYYKALKATSNLIEHEQELMANAT